MLTSMTMPLPTTPKVRSLFTSEVQYTPEEAEIFAAMQEYQRRTGVKFLTCRDYVAVMKSCGWQKVGHSC